MEFKCWKGFQWANHDWNSLQGFPISKEYFKYYATQALGLKSSKLKIKWTKINISDKVGDSGKIFSDKKGPNMNISLAQEMWVLSKAHFLYDLISILNFGITRDICNL